MQSIGHFKVIETKQINFGFDASFPLDIYIYKELADYNTLLDEIKGVIEEAQENLARWESQEKNLEKMEDGKMPSYNYYRAFAISEAFKYLELKNLRNKEALRQAASIVISCFCIFFFTCYLIWDIKCF
mgnify:CR=1 FL=1